MGKCSVKDHQKCNLQICDELLLLDGFDPRTDGCFCLSNTLQMVGMERQRLDCQAHNMQL